MALTLYNTKSRSVELFKPIKEGAVTMYACGPTVYDYTHIGHMRKYIGDDLLRRTLRYIGYKVNHVMNITDVGHLTNDSDTGDDKFEGKAKAEGKTVWDISTFYTDYFNATMRDVHVLTPTTISKATEHIEQMISLNETLVTKGFAYETEQALYFDVSKDSNYGELSGQKLDDKAIGVRDDVVEDPQKRHPADFALWFKRVGKFKDHTMHWASPWGDGFPGWHIECSAMSMYYLGETIDIHTGGIDHIPVHHENEIAQSECATGHEFVHFWVHHAFLLVDGEKMSKSKHNFYTIEDIKEKGLDPVAIRLLFMQTSYRKPLNFTWEGLVAADIQLKKLQKITSHKYIDGVISDSYKNKFTEAICDDLNTAKALSIIWELVNDTAITPQDQYQTLLSFDEVLGLDLSAVPSFIVSPEAQALVERRDIARKEKDFTTSDKIRDELTTLGYTVLDTPSGTVLN